MGAMSYRFMKDVPIVLRLLFATAWVALVGFGIVFLWIGDWLFGGLLFALLGFQIWIFRRVQRGTQPKGRERVGMVGLTILILLLIILIVMRRFVS